MAAEVAIPLLPVKTFASLKKISFISFKMDMQVWFNAWSYCVTLHTYIKKFNFHTFISSSITRAHQSIIYRKNKKSKPFSSITKDFFFGFPFWLAVIQYVHDWNSQVVRFQFTIERLNLSIVSLIPIASEAHILIPKWFLWKKLSIFFGFYYFLCWKSSDSNAC